MAFIYRKTRAFELSLLFIIALIFRLWLTASIIGFNQPQLPADDAKFEGIGWTLAQIGHYAIAPGEPATARASPVLPLLLAGIYKLVGHQRAVAQIVLLIISASTVPVVFLLGKEIGGKQVGLLAGLWVAFDPFAWIFAGIFYSETLFMFVLSLAVLILIRVIKQPRPLSLGLLGVVLGLGALTRPNGLVVAFGSIALLPLVGQGRFIDWFRRAIAVLAIVLLVMFLWIGRNLLVFHRFIPTTSQTGEVLLGFYNETCLQYHCNEWISLSALPENTKSRLSNLDEMTRNDVQTKLALSTIQAHPWEWAALLPPKVLRFWMHDSILPNTFYRSNPPMSFITFQRVYYRLLLFLGLAGLFTLYLTGQRQTFIIIMIFFVVFSFVALILWGDARLRMPLHPLLAVAAAYPLRFAYNRIFQSSGILWSKIGKSQVRTGK